MIAAALLLVLEWAAAAGAIGCIVAGCTIGAPWFGPAVILLALGLMIRELARLRARRRFMERLCFSRRREAAR